MAGAERKEKLALPLQGGPAHTCTHLPVFVLRRERTQPEGATAHLMEKGMQCRQRAELTLVGTRQVRALLGQNMREGTWEAPGRAN